MKGLWTDELTRRTEASGVSHGERTTSEEAQGKWTGAGLFQKGDKMTAISMKSALKKYGLQQVRRL